MDGELRAAAPPEAQKDYADAAGIALPAMRRFHEYLQNKLQYLDNADWRLGSDLYPKKFHFALESGGLPQDLLVNAERELGAGTHVRAGAPLAPVSISHSQRSSGTDGT